MPRQETIDKYPAPEPPPFGIWDLLITACGMSWLIGPVATFRVWALTRRLPRDPDGTLAGLGLPGGDQTELQRQALEILNLRPDHTRAERRAAIRRAARGRRGSDLLRVPHAAAVLEERAANAD